MDFIFNKKKNRKKIEQQFELVYKQYYMDILRYCQVKFGKGNEGASDCTQETFTLYFNKIYHGEEIEHIRGWLYRTADNFINREIVSRAKQNKKLLSFQEFDLEDVLYSADDIDFIIENKNIDIDKYLDYILGQLSPEEKKLYQRHYQDKISIKLLAKQYNISETAVTSRIYRLKTKIEKLAEQAIENETTVVAKK